MVISEQKIKVSELCQGYTDDGDGGVYGYDDGNHKLTISVSSFIRISKGGHTTEDNCQMLCNRCNNDKSAD